MGTRTEFLEILKRCREGLKLSHTDVGLVSYTPDSLLMTFRFADGKLYRLELKEVKGVPREEDSASPIPTK